MSRDKKLFREWLASNPSYQQADRNATAMAVDAWQTATALERARQDRQHVQHTYLNLVCQYADMTADNADTDDKQDLVFGVLVAFAVLSPAEVEGFRKAYKQAFNTPTTN